MTKEEQFQVYRQILLGLEKEGFEILDTAGRCCTMTWQGLQVSISVQNIVAQIKQDPERKERHIRQFIQRIVRQVSNPNEETERFWPRILPVTENRALSAPWTQPLITGKLEVAMIEEGKESVRFLQPLELVQRKLSLQWLKQESFKNMERAFMMLEWQQFETGIWGVEDQNGVSSAMLLLLAHQFPMKKEKIAVPTRNQLWICSDHNQLPLFTQKVMAAHHQLPYPISAEVFSWSDAFAQFYPLSGYS